MSHLKVKPAGSHGRVTHVTPESAGWTYVGFDLHRLKPGETVSARTGDREACLSSGMDGYIAKPIQPRELYETIEQILARVEAPTEAGTS